MMIGTPQTQMKQTSTILRHSPPNSPATPYTQTIHIDTITQRTLARFFQKGVVLYGEAQDASGGLPADDDAARLKKKRTERSRSSWLPFTVAPLP